MEIAVLGCGNMASALVEGMFQHDENLKFHTFTPSFTRAEKLANNVSGKSYKDIEDIPECDFYMIACKPQQVEELSKSLLQSLPKDKNILSILAGTGSKQLSDLFNSKKIIRVMPNTPCLVGEGVNLVYFSEEVSEQTRTFIVNQLENISEVFQLKEEKGIDDYVGISGSGPAYIFEIARILAAKAKSLGLEDYDASIMANQMIYGAAKMLVTSEDNAETLRNKVTSKKGVTYEALEVLKEYQLEKAFNVALDKATQRSIELGE